MKAILCAWCNDIRALPSKGPVTCSCGNVTGWWTNPYKGTAMVYAKEQEWARIIGIDNYFLKAAFREDKSYPNDKEWKQVSHVITEMAEGYLFHKDRRDCPVVIIGIGQTTDVSWSSIPYQEESSSTPGYAGRDEIGGSDF